MTGYRDLAIADLADDDALRRERIKSLEADVRAYQEIVSTLLTHGHEHLQREAVLRQRIADLQAENHRLREAGSQ